MMLRFFRLDVHGVAMKFLEWFYCAN